MDAEQLDSARVYPQGHHDAHASSSSTEALKRRRSVWVAAALGALAVTTVGVQAALGGLASNGANIPLNTERQIFRSTNADTSTSSTSFVGVPGLENLSTCRARGFTLTVSAQLSGAPAELRVTASGRQVAPGPIVAVPGSTSFVFGGKRAGSRVFSVEWRSLSGNPVTLGAGSVLFEYERPKPMRNVAGCA